MTPSSRQPLVDEVGPPPRDGLFHLAALPADASSSDSMAPIVRLRDLVDLIAVQSERHQGVEVAFQVNLVWQVRARQQYCRVLLADL